MRTDKGQQRGETEKSVGVTVSTTLLGVIKNSVKLNSGVSCNGW